MVHPGLWWCIIVFHHVSPMNVLFWGTVCPSFRQSHWQLRRQAVKKLSFDRISGGNPNTLRGRLAIPSVQGTEITLTCGWKANVTGSATAAGSYPVQWRMTTEPFDKPAWDCLKDLRRKWRWKTEWHWNGFVWKCGIPQNGNSIVGNDNWLFDHHSWGLCRFQTRMTHIHTGRALRGKLLFHRPAACWVFSCLGHLVGDWGQIPKHPAVAL